MTCIIGAAEIHEESLSSSHKMIKTIGLLSDMSFSGYLFEAVQLQVCIYASMILD